MPLFRTEKHPSSAGHRSSSPATGRPAFRLRGSRFPYFWLLLLILAAASQPALAGSLEVVPAAAFSGTYGLRVNVGSSCTGDNDLIVPDGTVSAGTLVGCTSLTANAVQVDGNVSFQAGHVIALGNGFAVLQGAQFSAGIDPTLPREAYVSDNTPAAETTYTAVFQANIDSLSMGTDEVELFTAYDSAGNRQMTVKLKLNAALGEKRLFVEARLDNGTFLSSAGAEALVGSGWHAVQVDWNAASGAGANDGGLLVFLDGSQVAQTQLANLDNDLARIDFVRWGAIGVGTVATGSLNLDDFASFR